MTEAEKYKYLCTDKMYGFVPPRRRISVSRLVFLALLTFGLLGKQPAWSIFPAAGNIGIFAGGSNGDGGSAMHAIVEPWGLAICNVEGSVSDLYIADGNSNRVRMVDGITGLVSTVAGTGVGGFAGDGGLAIEAELSGPVDVLCDTGGNVYIAERSNYRIRRVDTAGIITTVAGNGTYGFSGDNGPANKAALTIPYGLASDGQGNLYVADFSNRRVRKIDSRGIITTVAGTGTRGYSGDGGPATRAELHSPSDVEVDEEGNLYIADYGNSVVRMVDTQGIITTIVGDGFRGFRGDGGPAVEARLDFPFRVALDTAGNLLVLDTGNNRLRRVDTLTGIIETVAGDGFKASTGDGGPGTEASLFSPSAVAVDQFNYAYIGTKEGTSAPWSYNNRVRLLSPAGTIETVVGIVSNGDGGPAIEAIIDPYGLATGSGPAPTDLYIADYRNSQVRKVDGTTGVVSTVAGTGMAGFSGDGGPADAALLTYPTDVAMDTSGNLWIADTGNGRVRRVDWQGYITTFAGNGSQSHGGDGGDALGASFYPQGIDVDAAGNVYIADSINHRVRKVTPQRIITTIAGTGTRNSSGDGGLATQAELWSPSDVAAASDGSLYIVESGASKIRKVSPSGIITTVAGQYAGFRGDGGPAVEARLRYPRLITLDSQDNLFISDGGNLRVRRVDAATGIIDTVAGIGTAGVAGDGGLATQAELYGPTGIVVDDAAHLYISQAESGRVRVVSLQGAAPPSATPVPTRTHTPTQTRTSTRIPTRTMTPTKTHTPTKTRTPTVIHTQTQTPTNAAGVAGQVRYYNGNGAVPGVDVALRGPSNQLVQSGLSGSYAVTGIPLGSWSVEAAKTGDLGDAVSALDATYVLQALVGLRSFNDSQRLACDVTGNGQLSPLDATQILKHSIGIQARFPVAETCGSDWLFVPSPEPVQNQLIIEPQIESGTCQPASIILDPIVGQATGQDFLAILFGDCSGNWQPSAGAGASAKSLWMRSKTAPVVRVGRLRRSRAGRVRLPLSVKAGAPFHALDIRLSYDPSQLRIVGIRPRGAARGALTHYNSLRPGGLLAIALASATPIESPARGVVVVEFRLRGRPTSLNPAHVSRVMVDERRATITTRAVHHR